MNKKVVIDSTPINFNNTLYALTESEVDRITKEWKEAINGTKINSFKIGEEKFYFSSIQLLGKLEKAGRNAGSFINIKFMEDVWYISKPSTDKDIAKYAHTDYTPAQALENLAKKIGSPKYGIILKTPKKNKRIKF